MDKYKLVSRAARTRKEFGEDSISPVDIFALIMGINGLSIFFYPLGDRISGMCIKADKIGVIAINSEMSKGRQRFTLAHELYHYKYGNDNTATICPAKFSTSNNNEIEQEADRFASYLLLPPGAYEDRIEAIRKQNREITQSDLIQLEQQYGLSHQALLWRLTNDGVISPTENLALKDGIISTAKQLGYDTSLYKKVGPEKAEKKVYGHYIKTAEMLFEKGKISSGKYDELLLDGYRADIVYGDEEDDQIAD